MDHGEAAVRPLTLSWVGRQLEVGERVVRTEVLRGGITAETRRLTVAARDGGTRWLVLRSYVDPYYVRRAEAALTCEAEALTWLAGIGGVPAPELVAVDATAAQCEYPSLLMTHMPGRTVLDDEAGLGARVAAMARRLAAIHAVRPAQRLRVYEALTTAETVVVPKGADAAAWAAAIDLIRRPAPPYQGCFLHRDFQPGNVLFDAAPPGTGPARLTGVVDWADACWGPADLDLAHCCTNLAVLHGPEWGTRFARAYQDAGGTTASDASERLFWRVRDALAFSEDVRRVSRAWRGAGRTDLTTAVVGKRLDAYLTALMLAGPEGFAARSGRSG